MNPVLRSSVSAAGASLARRGWLPLAIFLFHELAAHVFDIYRLWPAIDVPFHFLGGFAIAFFAAGHLNACAARGLVRRPDPILRLFILFAAAVVAAVFWEFAEWTADRFLGTACQLGNDDTVLDLLMGSLGGLAYVLPQIPRAGRAFLRSSPGPEVRP